MDDSEIQCSRIVLELVQLGGQPRYGKYYVPLGQPVPSTGDLIDTKYLEQADTFGQNWPGTVRVIGRRFTYLEKIYTSSAYPLAGNVFKTVEVLLIVETAQ